MASASEQTTSTDDKNNPEIKFYMTKAKCNLCAQEGNCVADILYICQFCHRKIIFNAITGINMQMFGLIKKKCPKCEKNRVTNDWETKFCNCL